MTGYVRALFLDIPFEAFTRDVWLMCLSNAIGAFGEGLYFWVFPLYIKQLHADYVQIGLVFSALYGASALAPLPGGLLADRFDRKKILILSWAPWVFAPLLYSFAQNWVQLIPGAVCWGVSMIGLPAMNAYIITSVNDSKNLATVMSFVWSSYSFSYIFAPTVGGFLATIIEMQWVLRLSTVLCAAATIIFLFLSAQRPRKDGKTRGRQPLSSDEGLLWRRVLVWSVFFTTVTFFVAIGRTFVPTFLSEQVGLNDFYVGLFGSVNFAGITFIGIAMGRLGDRWRKSSAISLCLLLFASSIVLLMTLKDAVLLMFIAFFYGSSPVINSLVGSFVGTIAPEHRRGLWSSIPQTFSLVAAFVASSLAGYLYTQSPYYAFVTSVIALPFLLLFALTKLRE
jgi:MFS family permease